jgi:integrase/recombinase XerD
MHDTRHSRRFQKALNLEVGDIDSNRMIIHIHRGKGAKDRMVPLPAATLAVLRTYWKSHRHPLFIFPAIGRSRSTPAESPMVISSVQGAMKAAVRELGITKRNVHIQPKSNSSLLI